MSVGRIWQFLVNSFSSFGLSLFLAVIIWVVAVNTQNPLHTERSYPSGGIPIRYNNLAEGLVIISGNEQKASVEIRAPQESWGRFEETDLLASVDLTGLGPGIHQVPITVDQIPPGDPHVNILRIMPDRLRLEVDQTLTRTLPIKLDLLGAVPFSYQVLTPTLAHDVIQISGPSILLSTIDRAVISVDVTGNRTSLSAEPTIQLFNQASQRVDTTLTPNLHVEPTTISVTVPIQQRPGYRELIVNPVIAGQPDRGYWMSNWRVDPTTISVVGVPSLIQALPSIVRTEEINISGERAGTIIRTARLQLPDDISPLDQRVVTVTVEISPWLSSTQINLAPVTTGLEPGLSVGQISPPTIDVLVEGPQIELEGLSPSQVIASLDLTKLSVGTYLITPTIRTPNTLEAQGVLPEQVEVTIVETQGQRIFTPTITVANLSTRFRSVVSPPTSSLVISGSVLALQTLALDEVQATIDGQRLEAGVHVFTPTITLPSGFVLLEASPLAHSVEIFSATASSVISRTLTWDNLTPGLILNLEPRAVNIRIRGPGGVAALQANRQIRVLLNLRGLDAGRYTLRPQVLAPMGYEVVGITPETVEVSLSRSP